MSASISYSFSPTTTIQSSQVNQNFTDLVNYFNNTACVPDMVIGWKGAVGSIPTGWTLDNDLKDKFIVGAGNSYAVGDTGGTNTKDLSHVHTGPSHNHSIPNNGLLFHLGGGGYSNSVGVDDGVNAIRDHNHGGSTGSGGTGNTGSGGSATQDIRPPYYALAWLKKT